MHYTIFYISTLYNPNAFRIWQISANQKYTSFLYSFLFLYILISVNTSIYFTYFTKRIKGENSLIGLCILFLSRNSKVKWTHQRKECRQLVVQSYVPLPLLIVWMRLGLLSILCYCLHISSNISQTYLDGKYLMINFFHLF